MAIIHTHTHNTELRIFSLLFALLIVMDHFDQCKCDKEEKKMIWHRWGLNRGPPVP